MQNQNAKLRLCIAANVVLLVIIVTLITAFRSGQGGYWNYGPSDKFVIVSVTIDTWSKYYWLLAVITVVRITKVIIQEIAHPIIGFNIYNPDKTEITGFTKNELQLYGNLMYFVDSIRRVFMVMVDISQIDVALYGVIISEITSIYTIRLLLNEKTFPGDYQQLPTDELKSTKKGAGKAVL